MIDDLKYFSELKWKQNQKNWEKFRYLDKVPRIGKSTFIMWDIIIFALYGVHPKCSWQLVDINEL